jgi:hypothetical protein
MPDLQEGFWDDLLDYIQDGTVIPVIGSELVTVREDDRDVPLYRWQSWRGTRAKSMASPSARTGSGWPRRVWTGP